MDRDQWLNHLKERADQSIFHDVVFSPEMEEKVRRTVERERQKKAYFSAKKWPLWSGVTAAVLLLAVLGTVYPAIFSGEHGSMSPEPPTEKPWLPGTVAAPPDLWKPSPRTEERHDNQTFSYLGEKPVRIITDETGLYEDQTQKVVWLLDGSFEREVELVAYSTAGKRLSLGKYEVAGPLYDAKGHFPSGIVLPEPGVWKIQVLSGGEHFGQVFVQVQKGIAPANRDWILSLVKSYLQTAGGDLAWLGSDRQMEVELIGVEAPVAEQRRVYAWVKITGGANEASPGLSCPMVLDILYGPAPSGGSGYRVVGHRIPADGKMYRSSLEEMFPEKYLRRLDEMQKR